MRIPLIITLLAIGVGLFTNAAHAQLTVDAMKAAEVGALNTVPADQLPKIATFYSWQFYWQPPLPFDRFPELTVYDLGGSRFLIDDRFVEYSMSAPAPGPGTNPPPASLTPGVQNPMSEAAYGCALWLQINPSTNNRVLLTVHNTLRGRATRFGAARTSRPRTGWRRRTSPAPAEISRRPSSQ